MSAVGDLGGTNEAVWYVADLDFFPSPCSGSDIVFQNAFL